MPRWLIASLVAGAIALPMVAVVLAGLGRLLAIMQDADGAGGLTRVAMFAGALWAVDLVALVIVLGCDRLQPPPGSQR